MTTLYADINNGILTSGDDHYVTETLSEKDFLAALSTLEDGEYIKCTTISEITEAQLQEEYGVH